MAASLRELERAQKAGELLELAALSPGGLRSAFEEVSGLLNAEMFQLFNFTHPEAPDMIVSPHRNQIFEDYIARGWHEHDTWSHLAAKIAKHGRVINDDCVTTPEERRRDAFYQEFCPKWNIGSFTAWTFDFAGEKWAYTLMGRRDSSSPPIDETVYRRFIQSADRAALLAAGRDTLIGQGIVEGLHLAGRPSVIIDHHGRVTFATPSAEALFGQGFSVRGGRLQSSRSETDYAFRQLIRHASSPLRGQLHNFLIQRSDGRRPILAMPVHVRDRGLSGLPGARIILMLADLDASPAPDVATFRAAFAFSPREAELACKLCSGISLEASAVEMDVSIHTVRQMLKGMFAKTQTHRQAELIALLQRVPPVK